MTARETLGWCHAEESNWCDQHMQNREMQGNAPAALPICLQMKRISLPASKTQFVIW